jgi:hypothetical protein
MMHKIILAMCLSGFSFVAQACDPYIEQQPAWSTASFRPHSTAFERCQVDEENYRRVIREWLLVQPSDAPIISSLFLGRLVSFPWISHQLADSALGRPQWATRIARARPEERARMAAEILRDPVLLKRLGQPFEDTRYTVVGVSFEKILFGNAADYTSDKKGGNTMVPFDAQFWLRLGTRTNN